MIGPQQLIKHTGGLTMKNWKMKAKRALKKSRNDGSIGPGFILVLAAIIRALHAKGVLTGADRDFLFHYWDQCDAAGAASRQNTGGVSTQ
jgi:hypothetical protein